jgi:hypothetical protein
MTDAPHAQDWASVVATSLILEVRQTVSEALTDALNSTLRNRMAGILREELTARETELYAEIRNKSSD